MNISIVDNITLTIGFLYLFFVPFDRKRIRVRWAKIIFILVSIIGIARSVVGLAWDLGWFSLGGIGSRILDRLIAMAGGLLLGFLFSLIFSGQLTGKK
jgi:hypothetical protein